MGPELPPFPKNFELIDTQDFVLDDDGNDDLEYEHGEKYQFREGQSKKNRKNFCGFFDECLAREFGSYVSLDDMYSAYLDWMETNKLGDGMNRQAFGRHLKDCKKTRKLHSRVQGEKQIIYLDLKFKDESNATNKVVNGEIYKFYKLHFIPDSSSNERIPVDRIYSLYKKWCNQQGLCPIHPNGFSRTTTKLMKKSSLHCYGKTENGGTRRWLLGHRFND